MPGIEGKVIAVTGASSGIGAATARHLSERGALVVLAARRQDRLTELAQTLHGPARTVAVDVRRRADLQAMVDLAVDEFGRLDVLVGNAGIGPVSPLDDLRVDDWDAMIDINLKGLMYGVAAALPVFRGQGAGHFVHTVSTAAYKTVPGQVLYSASKTAARTFTEGLRQEAGPSIRVCLVSPGFTDTDFIETIPDDATRTAYAEQKAGMAIPPEAIARAIGFAIEQPVEVDVNEIVVRPTAQG